VRPVAIDQPSAGELRIRWDDGHEGRHTTPVLRAACPCASCKADHDPQPGGPVLLPILVPGRNEIKGIVPVGSYALQFSWGDGHRTGIYTYDYLRSRCECQRCLGPAPGAGHAHQPGHAP
jgi:DUF971 family protein